MQKIDESSVNVESREIWEETWEGEKSTTQRVWNPHLHMLERLTNPKKGQTVLEPGSGTGLTSLMLGKKHSMRVVLLDYSRNALKIARRNARSLGVDADLILGDLRNMPLRNGIADIVWNDGVNEHFEGDERQLVFNEMGRLIKEGGKVVVLVPNGANILYTVNREVLEATGRWNVGFERAFTPLELYMRMRKSGLRIIAKAGDNPIFSLFQVINGLRGKTLGSKEDGGGASLVSFVEKVEMALCIDNPIISKLFFYVGGRIAICGSTFPRKVE